MNSASKISKLMELLRKQIHLLYISTHWEFFLSFELKQVEVTNVTTH